MKNLVRAELLKLRTTRMFYGNALAALAFVPLFVAIAIQTAGGDGGGAALDTGEGTPQRAVGGVVGHPHGPHHRHHGHGRGVPPQHRDLHLPGHP